MEQVKGHHDPTASKGDSDMWTTPTTETNAPQHLSHDLPCPACGHAVHTYLACSDTCACPPSQMPGALPLAA